MSLLIWLVNEFRHIDLQLFVHFEYDLDREVVLLISILVWILDSEKQCYQSFSVLVGQGIHSWAVELGEENSVILLQFIIPQFLACHDNVTANDLVWPVFAWHLDLDYSRIWTVPAVWDRSNSMGKCLSVIFKYSNQFDHASLEHQSLIVLRDLDTCYQSHPD